jgi:hypothetical protein
MSSEADVKKFPIRIVLRWNPSIQKCKVYVGQILCNYDDQGIRKAKELVAQITDRGVDTAEIDGRGDVPMHWVMEALDMLIKARLKTIHFTGHIEQAKKK